MKKKAKKAAKKSSAKKSKKKPNPKKTYVKKKTSTPRKKTTGKTSARTNKKSRLRGKKLEKSISKKAQLPSKKYSRKTGNTNKVSKKSQRRNSDKKRLKQDNVPSLRISGKLEIAKQTKKTGDRINYTFREVRAVDKKLALFKAKGNKAINKQLKKFGGKPPLGIVVTVTDKKGREKTELSRFDFVVNEKNVTDFVNDMLSRMKDDFLEWVEMTDNGNEPADDLDSNPYGDYNPDSIASIQIKFIYPK